MRTTNERALSEREQEQMRALDELGERFERELAEISRYAGGTPESRPLNVRLASQHAAAAVMWAKQQITNPE